MAKYLRIFSYIRKHRSHLRKILFNFFISAFGSMCLTDIQKAGEMPFAVPQKAERYYALSILLIGKTYKRV
jgi:hypothetical protein